MKRYNNIYKLTIASLVILLSGCQKYLDREPLSQITPDKYLNDESQLAAYAINQYSILPTHGTWSYGTFGIDGNTDNQVTPSMDNIYAPGQFLVAAEGGDWNFGNIYTLNYFLADVLPKYRNQEITGNSDNVKQYIGEVYFLRAYNYFTKLQALGDFPIIRDTLGLNNQTLIDSSKRQPRNEVARFILSDLDSAINLLQTNSPDGNKNRISKYCALLFKSRVALFEGTWLKYFKNTAFVPNGTNWPGKEKAYNANYQFPSGSIDGEIDYFLGESMDAAQQVADNVQLTPNTGLKVSGSDENPYLSMFGAVDMSKYSEVLLWRQFASGITTHNVPYYAASNDYAVGVTKGMVDSYLMSNGLPIYVNGSGYQGDDSTQALVKNRDGRLQVFLKLPGDTNVVTNRDKATAIPFKEPYPIIWQSAWTTKYTTGYVLRKGINFDGIQDINGGGFTGSIVFRATEAYLNYIEACYEKTNSLDNKATGYWQAIRTRAKVNSDYNVTIASTDMQKEKNDLGAYSAGILISPTLYNIRRERRNELIAEGLRMMDLKRWRAFDQLISTPYHVEGFKIWGPMQNWYTSSQLVYGASNSRSTVSDPSLSNYLRPFEILNSAISYQGLKWNLAHYLNPIAIKHFTLTSTNGDLTTSPIYQNPGWPLTAGSGPTN